jgi:hypothetical protein
LPSRSERSRASTPDQQPHQHSTAQRQIGSPDSSLSGNGGISRPYFCPSSGMAKIGGETCKTSKKKEDWVTIPTGKAELW